MCLQQVCDGSKVQYMYVCLIRDFKDKQGIIPINNSKRKHVIEMTSSSAIEKQIFLSAKFAA